MARLDCEYDDIKTVVAQYDKKLKGWKVLDAEEVTVLRTLSLFLNKCIRGIWAS